VKRFSANRFTVFISLFGYIVISQRNEVQGMLIDSYAVVRKNTRNRKILKEGLHSECLLYMMENVGAGNAAGSPLRYDDVEIMQWSIDDSTGDWHLV
jgi:hypothetical protein